MQQKSGLSRQVHPRQSPVRSRRVHASAGPDDEDAEGEEDEDGADAEDQELYCYCQKLSYGEVRLSLSVFVSVSVSVAGPRALRRAVASVKGARAALTVSAVCCRCLVAARFWFLSTQMIACDNEKCRYQWVSTLVSFSHTQ